MWLTPTNSPSSPREKINCWAGKHLKSAFQPPSALRVSGLFLSRPSHLLSSLQLPHGHSLFIPFRPIKLPRFTFASFFFLSIMKVSQFPLLRRFFLSFFSRGFLPPSLKSGRCRGLLSAKKLISLHVNFDCLNTMLFSRLSLWAITRIVTIVWKHKVLVPSAQRSSRYWESIIENR